MTREYTADEFRAGKVPGTPALIAAEARVDQATSTVTLRVPTRLVSEANRRGAWYTHDKRRKGQRQAVATVARMVHPWLCSPPERRYTVTITRIAPRMLDTDNLASSAKAVRDEVAKWLGVSDGPRGPVTWLYAQRAEGKSYGCEIVIERRGGA